MWSYFNIVSRMWKESLGSEMKTTVLNNRCVLKYKQKCFYSQAEKSLDSLISECFTDKASWLLNKIQKQMSHFRPLFGLVFRGNLSDSVHREMQKEACYNSSFGNICIGLSFLGYLVLISLGWILSNWKVLWRKNNLQIKSRFLECFLGVGLFLWRKASHSMETHWDALQATILF